MAELTISPDVIRDALKDFAAAYEPTGAAATEVGTVVDAARLTSEQVQTFVDARAPFMSAEEAAKERELYAGVDGQNVAEDQLLDPAEELRPKALLEGFNHDLTSARDVGPLVEKRQTICPSFYCGASPSICSIYGCRCNGSICVIY